MRKVPPSRSFQKSQGPSIMAEFYIEEGAVANVELALAEKSGFSWTLYGDTSLDSSIAAWLESYCSGKEPTIVLPLLIEELPSYTKKVLRALRKIPLGTTTTYQTLAQITGNPRAARAVGNACGRNPVPLIIPCHRVLAAGGRLGGFSQGPGIKERLLSFELRRK